VTIQHHHLTVAAVCAICALAPLVVAACGSTHGTLTSPSPASDSANLAWVVGDDGTILATVDQGAHWTPQKSGTSVTLAGACFADATHGWAVGGRTNGEPSHDREVVLSTSDGGVHWARQRLGRPGGFLLAAACADRRHVWLGGLRGPDGKGAVIVASSDGGATWKTQYADSLPENLVSAIAFADDVHGWAVTEYSQVLATTDGGAHWKEERLPSPRQLMLESVACSDPSHCWIVGLGEKDAVAFATTDGGATWRTMNTPGRFIDFPSVVCLGARRLCLAGFSKGSGTGVYTSADSGATWRASSGAALDNVDVLAACGSKVLWALGDHSIAGSSDGGATWVGQVVAQSPLSTFHDIACPPAGSGGSPNP
jgi:photosystem II stability/assembly factor-like uncharacterized protein